MAAGCSGGVALTYELSWSRALVVPLGNSADATTLVLSCFMLGMALGNRMGGELAERTLHPARWYATLELLLSLFGLFAPRLLVALSSIHGAAQRPALAAILVVLPCLCMGASLPLLIRALAQDRGVVREVGILYGINTLGAAVGVGLTGYYGIARVGVSGCSRWAALVGVLAAVLAWVADRPRRVPPIRHDARSRPWGGPRRAILFAALVSGATMVSYEVLWGRLLVFVFGHDTYAFTALLLFVLMGLALGGLLHRSLARRQSLHVLATTLALSAVTPLLCLWAAAALIIRRGRDPFGFETTASFSPSLSVELLRELAYTPILLLLPAVLSGLSFAAACAAHAERGPDAGRRMGQVGWVNGIGAGVGGLVVALGLVSQFGIQRAFVLMAVLSLAAALAVAWVTWPGRRVPALLVASLALVSTVAVIPEQLPRQMLLAVVGPRHQRLLHYAEARIATISVIENRIHKERQLLVNAVNEVTTRLVHDQSFKLLGHLGPLLHENPQRAVMVCLGAGLSAGAALAHPIRSLDVVDLSAAIPDAARHFANENNHVLSDPRLHVHIGDGRQFLLNAREPYDLAIVDSTHPKSVDSWILYTREFYQLVRDKLSSRGLMVQWLPLHGLSESEFFIVVETFRSVFPDMTLWVSVGFETYGQVGYAKLVASKTGPVLVDLARLEQRLHIPSVKRDLARYGMDNPEGILDAFWADAPAIARRTRGLPIQTDDRPLLPFVTRFSKGRRMVPALLMPIRTSRGWPAPIEAARQVTTLLLSGDWERALALAPRSHKLALFANQRQTILPYYSQLAARYPDDPRVLFETATQLSSLGHAQRGQELFERAMRLAPDDFRLALNAALNRLALGQPDLAITELNQLRREAPQNPLVFHNLGVALSAQGDPEAAATQFELALALDPEANSTRLALAEAHLAGGNLERARSHLLKLETDWPFSAEVQDYLGLLSMRRNDVSDALAKHQRAVDLDPTRPALRLHLAIALAAQNEHARAVEELVQVLEMVPDHAEAALWLGRVLGQKGSKSDAVQSLCLARHLGADPNAVDAALRVLGASRDACATPTRTVDIATGPGL